MLGAAFVATAHVEKIVEDQTDSFKVREQDEITSVFQNRFPHLNIPDSVFCSIAAHSTAELSPDFQLLIRQTLDQFKRDAEALPYQAHDKDADSSDDSSDDMAPCGLASAPAACSVS